MQQRARCSRRGWLPPTWPFAAALVLGCAIGCAPPLAEPATSVQTAAPPAAPPAALSDSNAAAGKPAAEQPRISVDQVKGGSIEYARAIVAPTARIINECRTGAPTAVRVRITSENGEAALHVEPGSALDGSIRRCVLEALSTIELPDATPRGNASGFSSLITVQW